MLVLGFSHPGRVIVAVSYADEFLNREQRPYLMPLNNILNGLIIIFTALYYQFISKDIAYIQWCNLFLVSILILFTIVYLPESPKFLHSKERYDEARNSLSLVARVNGIKNFNKEEIIFENEKAKY